MGSNMDDQLAIIPFRALAVYIITAFAAAYLLDLPLILGYLPTSYFGVVASIRMWMPFLASIAALRITGYSILPGLKSLGWRIGRIKYVVLGLATPYILYGLGVILLLIAGHHPENPLLVIASLPSVKPATAAMIRSAPTMYLLIQLVSVAIAGLTINAALALGEETGWRGLMYKALTPRYGLVAASIITGITWGLWHADLIIYLKYSLPHHPDILGVAVYTCFTTTCSFILYILRHYSSSILPPAVMHGTLNALGTLMMLTYPVLDEIYTLPVGLASIASMIILGVIIYVFLEKRKKGI